MIWQPISAKLRPAAPRAIGLRVSDGELETALIAHGVPGWVLPGTDSSQSSLASGQMQLG